jgi:hypothetical protein
MQLIGVMTMEIQKLNINTINCVTPKALLGVHFYIEEEF